jgi:hypothetical protein
MRLLRKRERVEESRGKESGRKVIPGLREHGSMEAVQMAVKRVPLPVESDSGRHSLATSARKNETRDWPTHQHFLPLILTLTPSCKLRRSLGIEAASSARGPSPVMLLFPPAK